jgi:hypothetical protein
VDGGHSFYSTISTFDTDHPPFGWWRSAGLQDTAALHFNHQVHLQLQATGLRGIDKALERLKGLECGSCHQPDPRGRHMMPVRYDRDCAACHALSIRIPVQASDRMVQDAVEGFSRQPAPHVDPPLVSAVLRERLRLLGQENPLLWKQRVAAAPLRSLPGRGDISSNRSRRIFRTGWTISLPRWSVCCSIPPVDAGTATSLRKVATLGLCIN